MNDTDTLNLVLKANWYELIKAGITSDKCEFEIDGIIYKYEQV